MFFVVLRAHLIGCADVRDRHRPAAHGCFCCAAFSRYSLQIFGGTQHLNQAACGDTRAGSAA